MTTNSNGIVTHKNETAYGFAETQREVVAINLLIFRNACYFAAPLPFNVRGMEYQKQIFFTTFYNTQTINSHLQIYVK
jgi:hypothetical protein